MIEKISKASRKGITRATQCYEKLIYAAHCATNFGCNIESIYFNISQTLGIIAFLNQSIDSLMKRMKTLILEHSSETFIQQIHWLDSITGVGLLSAVTIMCEIGDFSVFKNPKQLFAYFGMDPSVNESGKFKATNVHMSKRGSRIARRAPSAVQN